MTTFRDFVIIHELLTARAKGAKKMEEKKNLLTYAGLKQLEEELHDLKVVKRKEVAQKIKECCTVVFFCEAFAAFIL